MAFPMPFALKEFVNPRSVYKVVDGDTLDAFPVGRVRLADVDAPELGD